MVKEEVRICPICSEKPLKHYGKQWATQCISCAMKKKYIYPKYDKKKETEKICKKCSKKFLSKNKSYEYCQSPCTSKKDLIENFLNKKEKKP